MLTAQELLKKAQHLRRLVQLVTDREFQRQASETADEYERKAAQQQAGIASGEDRPEPDQGAPERSEP